jgi:hypothetical protein
MKYGQIVEYAKLFGAMALNLNIKIMNKIARFYFYCADAP